MISRDAAGGSAGLRALSVIMGVFVFAMGTQKIDWLSDPAGLLEVLRKWQEGAPAASRWYLESVAIPGAPLFSRLVPLAELAAGAALVAGFRLRLVAGLALLMVLNFHFAAHVLFDIAYLRNAYGPPVLGGLLALALGGTPNPPGRAGTIEEAASGQRPKEDTT